MLVNLLKSAWKWHNLKAFWPIFKNFESTDLGVSPLLRCTVIGNHRSAKAKNAIYIYHYINRAHEKEHTVICISFMIHCGIKTFVVWLLYIPYRKVQKCCSEVFQETICYPELWHDIFVKQLLFYKLKRINKRNFNTLNRTWEPFFVRPGGLRERDEGNTTVSAEK